MARASSDLVDVFLSLREWLHPGLRTGDLDARIEEMILDQGNQPAFRGYRGFPASACISVNEEVVHGVPGDRVLLEGDLVSVDIGLRKAGWHADSAETFCLGEVRPEVARLRESCAAGLQAGIAAARPGGQLMDIGRAIESRGRQDGFGVVETLVGHGIGRELHEAPKVPNYECFTLPNPPLEAGMVLALEPMFTLGGSRVRVLPDGWTVVTSDGAWSAHFEHTVAITQDGPVVLTAR